MGVDSTEFVIGLIPLGGYVRMLDERDGSVKLEECHRAFNRQKLIARAAIVSAGPFANFLLAALLYWIALMVGIAGFAPVIGKVLPGSHGEYLGFLSGEQIISIDQRPVVTWSEHHLYLVNQTLKGKAVSFELRTAGGDLKNLKVDPDVFPSSVVGQSVLGAGLGLIPELPPVPPIIGKVLEGFPAEQAGLRKSDVITGIDDIPINDWRKLVQLISTRQGQLLKLSVRRENQTLDIQIVPRKVIVEGVAVGRIGVVVSKPDKFWYSPAILRLGPLRAMGRAIDNTWLLSALTMRSIAKMLTFDMPTENLGGPVTIALVAGESARIGPVSFLLFLAVISVSLGVLNLLPIPVLDGGHLLYFLIEAIKGTPVSTESMQFGQRLGISALAIVMGIALYNDMIKLIS
jgi:regulator of sigma E protease